MITIKETTMEDIKNVQHLWADGDVMRFVGFPDGLRETDEAMQQWLVRLNAARPIENHYSIYENGKYCGEAGYGLDKKHGSAWLDIKLFGYARGRGIATQAISYAMEQALRSGAETVWVDPDPQNVKAIALYQRLGFKQKDMPEHVIALGEDPTANIYFELCKE
ncbi:MAG TPA: GNAT family N-acetyltransferase [Candidatus Faecivivens stercorigallinarum]|nr:GNAT family N-acetyltransferase [Candidatus Faecivivens stercorigallinarum]